MYYLGEIASQALKSEIENIIKVQMDLTRICEVFRLACLLHDVGHAPFSHTGEEFYLDANNQYDNLHRILIDIVNSDGFWIDIPLQKSSAAAPHEIMSAIIGIKEFPGYFQNPEERELFARCITGYKYSELDADSSLKNCFILLLNSKVIDVDRLDYLIRDAYITGFDTVNIDYERLLKAITIVESSDGSYELAYYKEAISVIENVVYAHDVERKWIQNHPVVLYEAYILQHTISRLNSKMNLAGKQLFSLDSLGKKGQKFGDNLFISLLCDDDIIFLMKNVFPDELSKEYFERRERRHPLWKSEAEYKAYFMALTEGGKILENFEKAMELTVEYLLKNSDSGIISDTLIQKVKKDLANIDSKELSPKTKEVQKRDKISILNVMTCLMDYAKENDLECDFVILKASQFNSGFSKIDFSMTKIVFKTTHGYMSTDFSMVASSYKAKKKDRDNFFYLFYNRKDGKESAIDKDSICRKLLQKFF